MDDQTTDPLNGYSLEEKLGLFKELEGRYQEVLDGKITCLTPDEFLSGLREEVASA
jgi:hypothetical protein